MEGKAVGIPRTEKDLRASRWILLICTLAVVFTAAFSHFAFERLPHLEDEVAYLFQARTLALWRLTVPSPEPPGAFWTPFVLDHQGQRFGKYPPGWPVVLGFGVLAQRAWLVNPLLSALVLYLVYALGRVLYDEGVGVLAAALGLLSPLFLVLGASYLSHMMTLACLLLFSLWFVRVAQGMSTWFAVGAGLALGVAFLTRSLTAAAYAVPFALYAVVQVVSRTQQHWPRYFLVAVAGGAVALLLPAYQWAVTGDPWLNPYLLWWPYDRIGFGEGIGAMPGGHSPYYAWINLRQDLSRSATDVLGWPVLSWVPLLLGLCLRPRRRLDWALLLPFLCLVTAYIFYWIGSPERLWGPRYYFEAFGALWLLAAVGLWKAWEWLGQKQARLHPALVAVLALMVVTNLATNLPFRFQQAHGFYGISRDQLEPIQKADLHNALVIVYAERWLEYGAMLGQMGPLLDDDIVYARGDGAIEEEIIAAFPGRSVYRLVGGQLSPVLESP